MWSNDPVADFERYDRQCSEELKKLPECVDCGEPIQDDHFYMICDEPICPECLENNYKKWTEDYIE